MKVNINTVFDQNNNLELILPKSKKIKITRVKKLAWSKNSTNFSKFQNIKY